MYYPTNALLWDIGGVIAFSTFTLLSMGCCLKAMCGKPKERRPML